MQREHYVYLLGMQGLGAAALNFFINAAIAMVMFSTIDHVPLWGIQSSMLDFLGTIFILSFITCLVVTPMTAKIVAGGKLPALATSRESMALMKRLPAATFKRALVFGLIFLVVFTPVVILGAYFTGLGSLPYWDFVVTKGLFAAVLAGIVTPLIALSALADASA